MLRRVARASFRARTMPVKSPPRSVIPATVKRFHYDSHDQVRTHLADFLAAYNFARRLKTLSGFTPCEYICRTWTS